MRLRTDDDIYRARLVYLGPPGYTLPVHLPYAQYGMFILLALVATRTLSYITDPFIVFLTGILFELVH